MLHLFLFTRVRGANRRAILSGDDEQGLAVTIHVLQKNVTVGADQYLSCRAPSFAITQNAINQQGNVRNDGVVQRLLRLLQKQKPSRLLQSPQKADQPQSPVR